MCMLGLEHWTAQGDDRPEDPQCYAYASSVEPSATEVVDDVFSLT